MSANEIAPLFRIERGMHMLGLQTERRQPAFPKPPMPRRSSALAS
jgi:hypothetical protein